jgi:hypothetical protein
LAGFESLFGGSQDDIFNISGSHSTDLFGRDGNDTFNFLGAGVLNGFIDGGYGSDSLDYSGYDSARVLMDAIKRAGKPDPKAIRKALTATRNFPAVTGISPWIRTGTR